MAWRRPGDKPLSEPMMSTLPTRICVTRPQWVNRKSQDYIFVKRKYQGTWYIMIYVNIICMKITYIWTVLKKWKNIFWCDKFTDQLLFKTRFPKVDWHTGGKWLIHGTQHCKGIQSENLELPCKRTYWTVIKLLSYLILSYPILSYLILSYLIWISDDQDPWYSIHWKQSRHDANFVVTGGTAGCHDKLWQLLMYSSTRS